MGGHLIKGFLRLFHRSTPLPPLYPPQPPPPPPIPSIAPLSPFLHRRDILHSQPPHHSRHSILPPHSSLISHPPFSRQASVADPHTRHETSQVDDLRQLGFTFHPPFENTLKFHLDLLSCTELLFIYCLDFAELDSWANAKAKLPTHLRRWVDIVTLAGR